MTIEHPIVVRLDGTNAEEGRQLLADAAPPNLHVEPTMLDAARRAVELAAVTDVWSERAEAYRQSRGAPRGRRSRSDRRVGGRARRRRSTSRPAAGTSRGGCARPGSGRHHRPGAGDASRTSSRRAEELPFADGSFDLVVSRLAAHHFADVRAAVREMARVARGTRDRGRQHASAARRSRRRRSCATRRTCAAYTEDEWRQLFAGRRPRDRGRARSCRSASSSSRGSRAPAAPARTPARVRELLADRIEDGWVTLDRIALKGLK